MKPLLRPRLALIASLLFCPILLRAQGDDNPTGVAGQFNGNVTSGGSYDPYTGNATRSITDIVVPGAVGAYPLAFTRTLTTRSSGSWANYPFGKAGAWRHSYQWEVLRQYRQYTSQCEQTDPGAFDVVYPDGRQVRFQPEQGNTGYFKSVSPGIGDRLYSDIDYNQGTGTCNLLLSDGGVVTFTPQISSGFCTCGSCRGAIGPDTSTADVIDFACVLITDPYGVRTTISHYPDGTIDTIADAANHSIKLHYLPVAGKQAVQYLEEWTTPTALGRTVVYSYVNDALDSVVYFSDPTLTAHYTYQSSNNSAQSVTPLIATCDDSMYRGAMSKIAYNFVLNGVYGQLRSERHYGGLNVDVEVSTLAITGTNDRQETRGDGKTRTFTYTNGLLTSWTDFAGNVFSQVRTTGGFVTSTQDPRTYTTTYARNLIGNITSVTYPATPSDTNGQGTVVTGYDQNNPYFPTSVTDERMNQTTYTRDPSTHRVSDINYPDANFYHPATPAHEGFVYNLLGQITRHQRKNGNYEHFEYDSRGLLIRAWNPVGSPTLPTSGPSTTISYYQSGAWRDRVQTITDARGNPTTFEYERDPNGSPVGGRGLVSRIVFPDNKDRTFIYDRLGNKLREENELHQPTVYVYDDYSRLTQVKVAKPDPNNPAMQAPDQWDVTTYDYAPIPNGNSYVRTASAATTVTSAAGVVVTRTYDFDVHVDSETRQNPGGESATTDFHYDPAGNLDRVTELVPEGRSTNISYDQRNRKSSSTSPPVTLQDGTVTQYTTQWYYDPAGNERQIVLPDNQQITRDYDPMNRLWHQTDQMQRMTTYSYFPSGMLESVRDPQQLDLGLLGTRFEYNERDLQSKMTYPNNSVVQGWGYDDVGNMTTRPTADPLQTQTFSFDERNRVKQMRWNNGIDFSDFDYDYAGRLTYARNPYSTVTREYDVAGRLTHDKQLLVRALNAPPSGVPQPTGVVSRMAHGSMGLFDTILSVDGSSGTESRAGGSYTLVITFPGLVAVNDARVIAGIGTAGSRNVSFDGTVTVVSVALTGVSNAQTLTLGLTITSAGDTGQVMVPMPVLVGDTNGDGRVTSSDVSQTRSYSGQSVSSGNFRCDINGSGTINSTDVSMVTAASGISTLEVGPAPAQADVISGYDADGRRAHLSLAGADYNFTYGYDGMGRLKTITQDSNQGAIYQYAYDRSSNVTQRSNWAAAQIFDRDELGRVLQRRINAKYYNTGSTDPNGYEFSKERYGYDAMSRVHTTDRTRRSPAGAVDVEEDVFSYNLAGELNLAQYRQAPNGNGFGNPERTMEYLLDKGGNRTSANETIVGGTTMTTYVPNDLNEYTTANSLGVSNGSEHEIIGYGSVNDPVAYRHLGDGALASASSASAGNYQLGYDALGRCVRRATNGVVIYYIYDGAQSIYEFRSGNVFNGNVLYGLGVDEIIARYSGGTPQWPLQDRLGNTSAVSDVTGQIIEQYSYDAFGTPEFRTGPDSSGPRGTLLPTTMINNRTLFTGRDWVQSFGFYENRARAYNPKLGRFMSEDPLSFGAGDTNLFRYCAGDPVNNTDPFGTDLIVGLYRTGHPWDHIGIGLYYGGNPQTVETWGFNPVSNRPLSPSDVHLDATDRRIDYVVLHTTPEQDAAVLDFIFFIQNNAWIQDYNFFSTNCAGFFVFDALTLAGINVPYSQRPDKLFQAIKKLPNASKPSPPTQQSGGTGGGGGGGGGDGSHSGGGAGVSAGFAMPVFVGINGPTPSQLSAFQAAYPGAQIGGLISGLANGQSFISNGPPPPAGGGPSPVPKKKN